MEKYTLVQRAKAFDYLFDAVFVTDTQGIITDWNEGSSKLYGYDKKEVIGQPVHFLHVTEDIDRITNEIFDSISSDGKWNGEIRMQHKDGHIGWIESVVVPLFDCKENMIGTVGINRDISSRVQKEENLARLAHYDALTKLPNRSLLLDRIEHLIKHAKRENTKFALLYIDLDNFKTINDKEGHLYGDRVLQETADKLKACIRSSDTAARIGGDEFVILLETIKDNSDINILTENILNRLNKPYLINNSSYIVSGSIGYAIHPDDGDTTDKLLTHADKSMYEIKNTNKKEKREEKNSLMSEYA